MGKTQELKVWDSTEDGRDNIGDEDEGGFFGDFKTKDYGSSLKERESIT